MNFNKKTINYLLIDGTSYLYQSYYSFSSFSNKDGIPSGAIYGVINMLKMLFLKYPNTQIIIIFDTPNKTFRHTLFQSYKANRPIMPKNLQMQIKPLYKAINMMGFPIVTIPLFEADDVIGTLAYEAHKNNKFTLICTNDKDLAQLVNINTNILEKKSHKILGKMEIKKKYGVIPKLIPDLFGLMGDTSDNIPGVPKIGKKTALLLLENFGSLKKIYKNIDKISKCSFRNAKNIAKTLLINQDLAFLSKDLATIITNIPMEKSINDLTMSKPSIKKLSCFFKYYGFYHWLELLKSGTWLINTNHSKV
ncbi:MAG: 5'-3' exonuclease H3TH domain-containing protein [Buchnera aphidicola (Meitanaphis elongallis)]